MKCVDLSSIGKGTRVFVRCDLDVPVKSGKILETFRLDASLKTLNYIIGKGGLPVLAGHLGRPGGKVVADLSTAQLRSYFDNKLLGSYELLENLRFDPREESNNSEFSKELAQKAEIYVNESFANSLREHASIVGVPKLIPAYAGFQLIKEVNFLTKVLTDPARPLLAVIGGAKIESKEPLIQRFAKIADAVLVGGKLGLEKHLTIEKVFFPIDYIDDKDIGIKTLDVWKIMVENAKTIVWAGPVGLFEDPPYSAGTKTLGEMIGNMTEKGCFTLAGGGDTISALDKFGLLNKFSFVSTGGSAMLDFLVNGTLPGIEVL